MKTHGKQALVAFMIVAAALVILFADDIPIYVGARKCKDCHRTNSQGRQYPIWESSKHAQAFNNLKTEAAKTSATEAGVTGAPEQSPVCLKCHAPLAEKAPELSAEGVTCEVCHGPGSNYKKLNIMMNHDEAVKNGLIAYASTDAVKTFCLNCHANAHGKTFDFAAAWELVKHPKPEK
jgi:hypothetical protein